MVRRISCGVRRHPLDGGLVDLVSVLLPRGCGEGLHGLRVGGNGNFVDTSDAAANPECDDGEIPMSRTTANPALTTLWNMSSPLHLVVIEISPSAHSGFAAASL